MDENPYASPLPAPEAKYFAGDPNRAYESLNVPALLLMEGMVLLSIQDGAVKARNLKSEARNKSQNPKSQ